ncbi:MAG: hypothetical protein ACK5M3_13290 [Dysgonomonas sp.]
MKRNKYLRYGLFCLSFLIAALLISCSDDKEIDYRDDAAYPPPAITLSSASSLEEVTLGQALTVAGKVEANNKLRDIYTTIVRKKGSTYEEIDRNARVIYDLKEFPDELDFSMNINVTQEDAAAVLVVATDVFTKTDSVIVNIAHIAGIAPKITVNPTEIASVELNGTVTATAHITSTEGLKAVSYVLVQKVPYRELQTPISVPVSGENEKDINISLTVDDENADAIAVIAKDTKDFDRTVFVDIKAITGIPEGRAYVFENIEMAAEFESYSGASPLPAANQPYLFSVEGISVGGTLKNVISLSDAINAPSGTVDFAFANIWRNSTVTGSDVNFGRTGNRGFAFVAPARINGGPVGRQIDLPWLASVTKPNTQFKIVTADIVASMKLDTFFETTTGNWETFAALNELSSFVPAYSSSNDLRYVVQRANAGTATAACDLLIMDGTYIAFRTGSNKFGIIKVVEAADDTDALAADGCRLADVTTGSGAGVSDKSVSALYSAAGLSGFDYTGVAKLYGRKCKLKIIVQK